MTRGSVARVSQAVVASFDEAAGHGTIAVADGDDLFFHCSSIADGSRSIAVGTEVTCHVSPGHMGRFEGYDIRPR